MASEAGILSLSKAPVRAQGARAPRLALEAVPWPRLAARVAAWDALALCASEPNPFYESWYLLPSLKAFDPGGAVCVLCFEADGDLAGLMPLARPSRYYRWPIPHLAGWLHDNAFLGAPLVAAGLEREFWGALLDWADRKAGRALFLHLAQLPLAGPLKHALDEVLGEQRRRAAVVHREDRAMLASDASPEAYFEATLSGKKRKELRRQFARLAQIGEVEFARRRDAEGLDEWIAEFLTLEAAGWKGLAGSALARDPRTRALFDQALRGAAERRRLERLALTVDGSAIAMLATFVTPPGSYSFKTAFDESYARFSPGVLLQCENLDILRREGVAWSDSCAAADHPMIDHIWRERRAIGRVSIAIGGRVRRAVFGRVLAAELARNPAEQAS